MARFAGDSQDVSPTTSLKPMLGSMRTIGNYLQGWGLIVRMSRVAHAGAVAALLAAHALVAQTPGARVLPPVTG